MDLTITHKVHGPVTLTVTGDGTIAAGADQLVEPWEGRPTRVVGFAFQPFQEEPVDVTWVAFTHLRVDVAGLHPVVETGDGNTTLLFNVLTWTD